MTKALGSIVTAGMNKIKNEIMQIYNSKEPIL